MTVGVGSGVRDVGMKETEWGGERSADGFRVGAERCDVVVSGVVGGNELFETGHDVVLVFGLGSKDCNVSGSVIDGDESLGVTSDGSSGEQLEVEEHAVANVGRWW